MIKHHELKNNDQIQIQQKSLTDRDNPIFLNTYLLYS